jgi:transposase
LLYCRLRLHHDARFTLNFIALSPILIIHVTRLGRGDREMDWKKLLGSLSESVDEELRLRNAYLATENRILRQQIPGRVPLSDGDRQALAEISQKLGRKALEEIATVAKPDTILAWHRQCASPSGDISQLPKAVGRPRIAQEIEELVVRIARENRSWGSDRIVGALANLGYTISDQTVGNMLKRHGIPPARERQKTISGSEFLRIHMDVLGATDFFTSPVWSRWMLVISCLLGFVPVGRHTTHCTDMTASLTTWFAPWDADVERWIRSVIEHVMSPLLGCGHSARRPLLSAGDSHDHQEDLPRSRGQVLLLPGVNPRPIRDGPTRHRPRRGARLRAEERAAACVWDHTGHPPTMRHITPGASLAANGGMMETPTTYISREPRPDKRTQELCMRGTGGRTSTIWHDRSIARMTPHEMAQNRELPEAAVLEALAYGQDHWEVICAEKDAERAWLEEQGCFAEDSPASR